MPVMTFSISATADVQKVEGAVRDTIQEVTRSATVASGPVRGTIAVGPSSGPTRRNKTSKRRGQALNVTPDAALSVYKTMRIGTIEGPESLVLSLKDKINGLDGITEVVIDKKGLTVGGK